MKYGNALTWDELANEYQRRTGNTARIRPMEEVSNWAIKHPEIFFYNEKDDTIHLIELDDKPKGKWVLTVDRCRQGFRGIFTDRDGNCFWNIDAPHTEDDMFKILGIFDLVLNPQSTWILEEDFAKYHTFIPLGEYQNMYGYVLSDEDFQRLKEAKDA